jgi:DNA replication protein DnaC
MELTELDKVAIRRFNIPPRFHYSSFESYDGPNKTLPDSCYLWGRAGCGKTHLAVAKIKQLLNDNKKLSGERNLHTIYVDGEPQRYGNLIFISVPKLLHDIRSAFDPGSGQSDSDIIQIYSECWYLVLDDLGAEKTTDFVKSVLYQIIDYRYNWMKNTIITSNLSLDELAQRFDDRVASRIAGMGKVIEITGKDRRIS